MRRQVALGISSLALTALIAGCGGGGHAARQSSTSANWKEVSPATSPLSRIGTSMAYDSTTRDVVLFGGANDANNFRGKGRVLLNDTWTWGQT